MRILLTLIASWVALGALYGQEKSPIVLKRANSLQSSEENGTRKQTLSGDVWMTRDSLSVTCQNAIYYPDSGLVIFRDNVEFKDPQRTLTADEVIYNEFTEEVFASNHVHVYQGDSLSAMSRTARYRERLNSGFLYDDVRIRQEDRRVQLTGDLGYLDHERKYGWVTMRPVLTERDSLNRVITTVHGDTISYDHETRMAHSIGHVQVERDSLTARGALLDYFMQSKYAELLGHPYAVRSQDTTSGDTMRIFFEGERLDHVEVTGHAVVVSPADSGAREPLNRMEGKKITMWVDSTVIRDVLVEGNAIATYYIRDQGRPKGMNVTSGDRLHVLFEDRRIWKIKVDGGTEGDYTPQKMVTPEKSRKS